MAFAVMYFSLGVAVWLLASVPGEPFADSLRDGEFTLTVGIIASLIFIALWPLWLCRAAFR
jgi:hypothetical protein